MCLFEPLENRRLFSAAAVLIQAEDFNPTGFKDTTPGNDLGAYRSTAVDVGPTKDTGGGYIVGHIKATEYVTYDVHAPVTGAYDIQFRLAAAADHGGKFHVEIDGATQAGPIDFPTTGGWTNFETITHSGFNLTAGLHTLRIVFDQAAEPGQFFGSLNWFKLVPSGATGATQNPTWPSAWTRAADSPVARFESYAFSYENKLYVMGGWADSQFDSTTRVDVYDPATNKWTRLADMKAPETHAGMAVDQAHGVVYFVGGHRGKYPSIPTDGVWKYTIATDTWTQLPVHLPKKLGANTAQVLDGKLHSITGNPADRVTNIGDHYVLDLSNISAGFKTAAPLPNPRDHTSSAVIDGKIYVMGGEFGHDIKHIQQKIVDVYDPATNKWTRLADAPIAKSHAEASTFVLDGKIIRAGGQVWPQLPTSSVAMYDPATNKWSTLASLPAARQGTTVQLVGDYFVMTVGGINTNQPQKTTWIAKWR
ncbi:MAG TPA: kelch repeat-containing protein [Tepidisphaeraceae bacterium]|nr:kelch repeat-containing protein [Tepidisphaeraceae bacterium]